jgi:hypothetical protein
MLRSSLDNLNNQTEVARFNVRVICIKTLLLKSVFSVMQNVLNALVQLVINVYLALILLFIWKMEVVYQYVLFINIQIPL